MKYTDNANHFFTVYYQMLFYRRMQSFAHKLAPFVQILTIVEVFMKYQSHFLHSSLREAEGMCQHAAIKV